LKTQIYLRGIAPDRQEKLFFTLKCGTPLKTVLNLPVYSKLSVPLYKRDTCGTVETLGKRALGRWDNGTSIYRAFSEILDIVV